MYLWSPLQSHISMSTLHCFSFIFKWDSANSTIRTPWVGLALLTSSTLIDSDKKFAIAVFPLWNLLYLPSSTSDFTSTFQIYVIFFIYARQMAQSLQFLAYQFAWRRWFYRKILFTVTTRYELFLYCKIDKL